MQELLTAPNLFVSGSDHASTMSRASFFRLGKIVGNSKF